MSKQSLEDNFISQFLAIDMCIEKNLILPSLILIYSCIDALASIRLPKGREKVKGKDYIKFCNDHLLPESSLNCSAIDLYAGRCSTLHKGTAVSDLSQRDEAAEIYYHIGVASELQDNYQKRIDEKYSKKVIIVDLDELRKALNNSYFSFSKELEGNVEMKELAYKRAKYYFVNSAPI
jgi:hypothetical protein